jgi:DNA modification methylase
MAQIITKGPGPERTSGTGRPLSIVYRNVTDLKLAPGNPRLHSPKQIRQIARSIEAFGFNVPVLIDAEMAVIAGYGRVLATRPLGLNQVPTIRLEHLTEAQIRAFMIADNRLTENSSWDKRLLAEQIKALSEVELDFTLEATGFEMGEIDLMIDGLAPGHQGQEDPADALPEIPEDLQVSRRGDLWILGRHQIFCGNALDESSYQTLLRGCWASMVFTDPPHNLPIAGQAMDLGRIQDQDFKMASGEMSESEFTGFLTQALGKLAEHSAGEALHFICMNWRHMGEVLTAGRRVYSELKDLCVWVKDHGVRGSLYRSQHELVIVFKGGKGPHYNKIQLRQCGRNRSNVWRYSGLNSLVRNTADGNRLELHPKPVALLADAITDCTGRGDIVLDPFLGSGTTVIAAERTGRICYGIELDPVYVDTAIRRWQALTGENAIKGSSRETFGELEREARYGQPRKA